MTAKAVRGQPFAVDCNLAIRPGPFSIRKILLSSRVRFLFLPNNKMASPRSFFKILCLFICVGMAWFSVVAKPIELPTLSQHRYITNSSHIVDAVGGMRNGNNRSVDGHPPATLVIDTPACIDNHHCTSGCKVTSAAPNIHTFTW